MLFQEAPLTHVVRAVLLPVDGGFSVLWCVVGLTPGGRRHHVPRQLLLDQLLAEGLLPRLHHVRHDRVDERQRLDGPPVEDRAVLSDRAAVS